jgi:hypothetical protein
MAQTKPGDEGHWREVMTQATVMTAAKMLSR